MSPPPLDNRGWLRKHLAQLMKAGQEIQAMDASLPMKPSYDKGNWTGLKLIALKYYIRPFLDLLGQKKTLAYVDLLAGPGLDRLGERQVPVPGSPLIPLVVQESQHRFQLIVVAERKTEYYSALVKRIDRMPGHPLVTSLKGDINLRMDEVIEALKQAGVEHSLVFIDPEGLEFTWSTISTLVGNLDCDVIVNFPSAGVARCLAAEHTYETLSDFLGVGINEVGQLDADGAIQVYRRKLASLGLNISTEIEIPSGMGYRYHLIPAVRATQAGSPWFEPIFGSLKKRIGQTGPELLDLVAQQIDGVLGEL